MHTKRRSEKRCELLASAPVPGIFTIVNLYRHGESRPSAVVLRDVLAQKCSHKGIALPTLEALEPHRDDLEAMWVDMLGHQLPVLPPPADFWAALPEVFAWIMGRAEAPALGRIEPGAAEVAVRTRVLPSGIPPRVRAPLEIIRFAAANQLCVDLTYDKTVRRIEPYSLRLTTEGNYVLHTIRSDSGEHRSYRVDRIEHASVAAQSFMPRYIVELTSEGPLPVASAARHARGNQP